MSFTRRRFIASAATLATTLQLQRAAHALGFSTAPDVCKLTPEQEVGPYYVADEMLRADIREGKPGIPLTLKLAVLDARSCKPLPHAAIDLWHCDALGIYSGYTANNPMGGGPGGPPPMDGNFHPPTDKDGNPLPPPDFDKDGEHHGPPPFGANGQPPAPNPTDKYTFLRGVQITDRAGAVSFQTIFPGFYMGRTNHIHFKVRLGGHDTKRENVGRTYAAGHTAHVGQVFFSEALNSELMEMEPYRSHKIHRTINAEDGVYRGQHGDLMLASIRWVDASHHAAGLYAEAIASVDPTATPAPVSMGFGPPPSRPASSSN
ncbi:intradiol ring-cleavage dioxygenase [Granulicella cerasi]|uniref:Intradiol ring-cleavage dioxygenase n=1 Tax=Granulicella cerasi TaxID=741063 RepID=A0ABW1Z9K2_9BACT|nr:intradiol ring-cleavage dioxygenase [Granulicella cerasi]